MKPISQLQRFLAWSAALLLVSIIVFFYARMIWAIPLDLSDSSTSDLLTNAAIWLASVAVVCVCLLYGKAWVKGVILSIMSFLITWLLLEGVCALVLRWKEGPRASAIKPGFAKNGPGSSKQTNGSLIHYDSLGMSRPAPGQYEIEYAGKDAPIHQKNVVTYHVDSLSRRITPFTNQHAVGKYALFMGCSFTYGESVSDSSTIPYFFGQQTGYHPYNYGVSGHSPTQMLAILQSTNLRNQISEKEGIAFYTYIDDHLARATPSTVWANNADGYLPHVNPQTLVVDGAYGQKHPTRMKLIRWMYKSNVVKLFKINFPKHYTTQHYQQFVNIVRKAKELYRNQFGNDNFYVVVFPMYPMDPELKQLIKEANLNIIDYSALLTWKTAYDGMHPNGDAYRQVARQLATDLHISRSDTVIVR
ncbi:hypothetical protein WBJ53_30370 [Spirosoma sp. SC4-14]|uniref:hypothetical protein n=1 Tax=Spirosoma sp. SC4-14 TaxID=3128900 RepID=UPI0030CC5548